MTRYRLTSTLGTPVQVGLNSTTLPADTIMIKYDDHVALIREAREVLRGLLDVQQYTVDQCQRISVHIGTSYRLRLLDVFHAHQQANQRAQAFLDKTKEEL